MSPTIAITWTCAESPVQADVTVERDGVARLAYFRARGACWEFDVWPPSVVSYGRDLPDEPPEWRCELPWGTWPEAGWMSREEAEALLRWAVEQWAAGVQDERWTREPPSAGPVSR